MTRPLDNKTVAIFEHRFTREFSTLFERLGAEVRACPLVEERPVENRSELQEFVRHVLSGNLDMMIFLTGVGAKFLIAESESIGVKDQFLAALGKLTVVVRGPKPVAALRQAGVRVDVIPANPTTAGVIDALGTRDVQGRRIGVQLYGTPNPELVSTLEERGAKVTPVQVYGYGAASDTKAISDFIGRIVNGQFQIVAFTTAPQVRMLFDFAAQSNVTDPLRLALSNTVLASIGEVTTRALEEKGLFPKIVPKLPKMAALAQAAADYFAAQ